MCDTPDWVKDVEDSVNEDVFDDALGVENLGSFVEDVGKAAAVTVLAGPWAGALALGNAGKNAMEDREREKGARALAAQQDAERGPAADARRARDLPTILANRAIAQRRRRARATSLLATGASGYTGASAPLSSVLAVGKTTLGE